ncbi:AMP-binding protein [Paraburkholderia silviterrae]|uniref:Long-chain-fatty-acid--CoA ligase n=1 Tax=Paraburkholderia silviterrae TaxID=2528715 RepID=A0A4R5MEG4_9BURK|nr:AMP-binding protein [Paraburkholderia silviterrae]TDG25284.1 long-chain fatty acid--CoA ligase [Paraburkholderia silviterrae]
MSDTPQQPRHETAPPPAQAATPPPAQALADAAAPNTDGIWYASYPPGVPHEVDVTHYASLVQFFDDCTSRFRECVAYVSAGSPMTYGALASKATAFGSWLQGAGVKPGERVAIMLPNTLQYPVALFGALKAGAVVVNVNPLYTPRELAHQLKDSGAQTIVVFESFAKTLEDALPGTRIERVVLTQLGDLLGEGFNLKGRFINFMLRHVKKLVPAYRLPASVRVVRLLDALSQGAREPRAPIGATLDDLAFLQYTGGTTGVAKGAMLTHGTILANVIQAKGWIAGQLESKAETILTPLPLYHIYSLAVNALIFMAIGARNILIANPRDMPRVMKILRHETFTCMSAVNTLYNAFLENEAFRQRDFSGLKLAMGGGMATQKAIAERFKAVTGKPIVEGYGLTECSPIVAMNPVDIAHLQDFEGSIGLPAPSTQVRFRRDDGTWANIGEPGELCVKGPQVMKGYWMRPDETARVFVGDGWLATGDIGVMDARGYIRLIDRKKDMILVSGFNVYPNEIEDVIARHPGVREVAAVGVPDPVQGERVKVFVVRRDPALTEDALIQFCRQQLTGYKVPRLVEFRETLPQSNIGKILRRALRDEEIAKMSQASAA